MSSYANEKHRTTAIRCATLYYHQKGGKERKQLDYYFNQHPEIDRSTFFTEDERTTRVFKWLKSRSTTNKPN